MLYVPFLCLFYELKGELFGDSLFPIALVDDYVFDLPCEAGELLNADERCHSDYPICENVALYQDQGVFVGSHFFESYNNLDYQIAFAQIRGKLTNKPINIAYVIYIPQVRKFADQGEPLFLSAS